ncbi:MAG: hypothetical protein WD512_15760 [Candidatus Paceibacterota bacterium]
MNTENKDDQTNPSQGSPWSEEKTKIIGNIVNLLAEKYFMYKDMEAKHETKYVESTSAHDRRIIFSLLGFLGILMGGLMWLTWIEKITGEALLFAVGLTIGFVFALIHRFIFGSQRTVSEESNSNM